MGYDLREIRVPLRLDRHGGPEQRADDLAAETLRMEIEALIASTPEYARIARIGVEGA